MNHELVGELIKSKSSSIKKADVTIADSIMPDIPNNKISTTLPAEVIAAMSLSQEQGRISIKNERDRNFQSLTHLTAANREINIAENNLDEIRANPFLEILGMFGEKQYNKEYQTAQIDDTKRKLLFEETKLKFEAQKDALDLKEAALPLDAYVQQIDFIKKNADMSIAQNSAIVQSNEVKKQVLRLYQSRLTATEIQNAVKNKDYNAILTPEFAQKWTQDMANFVDKMETSDLAKRDKRFDLSRKMLDAALTDVPTNWAEPMLAEADKAGLNTIVIPGTKLTVSVDRLRTAVAKKVKLRDEDFSTIASQTQRLVGNNAVWSETWANVESVSGGTAGTAGLNRLNLLNVTPETVANFDMEAVPPRLRILVQDVLQSTANLNDRQNSKTPITPQDVANVQQKVLTLNKATKLMQQDMVDSASKLAKPAMVEWTKFRQIKDQTNAAGIVVSNILTIPAEELNDLALSAAVESFQANAASEIVQEDIDLSKLEDSEKQGAYIQILAASNYKSKVTARDEALKAMQKKNTKGDRPRDVYAKTKIAEIMFNGMSKLQQKYPQFENYFTALGKKGVFANPQQLAKSLAALSFEMKKANPALEDYQLNTELLEIMNADINTNRDLWNAQSNPVRGGYMKLMFNTPPATLVDVTLTTLYGESSGNAWDAIEKDFTGNLPEGSKIQKERLYNSAHYNGRNFYEKYSPVTVPLSDYEEVQQR